MGNFTARGFTFYSQYLTEYELHQTLKEKGIILDMKNLVLKAG